MSLGKHNGSSGISVRLAERQSGENVGEFAEDRRRFWAKVRVLDSDTLCWLWAGSRTSNGRYGQFTWAGRYGRTPVGAHRAAWELTHGAIPAGQHVLHSCDIPLCVNPRHLFLGSHLANMQDAATKGRLHVSRPKRQRVTDEEVLAIIAAVRSGAKQVDLAHLYGVTKGAISQFVSGKRRQWLTADARRSA